MVIECNEVIMLEEEIDILMTVTKLSSYIFSVCESWYVTEHILACPYGAINVMSSYKSLTSG